MEEGTAQRPSAGSADPDAGHLKAIFEMSLDLICVADFEAFTFLRVNPAFTRVLGYSAEELLERPFLDFVHPEDVGPTRRAVDDYLRKGEKIIRFRNRYRCKTGGFRWLSWVSYPQPQEGICVAVARDITAQLAAEQENAELTENLKKTSHMLYTMLDAIPDVIGVQEIDHRVIRYNKAGYDLLCKSPDEVRGQRCFELIGQRSACSVCATSEVYRTKQVHGSRNTSRNCPSGWICAPIPYWTRAVN
jgi:PAS domain S-box-containing protein